MHTSSIQVALIYLKTKKAERPSSRSHFYEQKSRQNRAIFGTAGEDVVVLGTSIPKCLSAKQKYKVILRHKGEK